MKIVLLGPPGAGKGTQARFLCNAFSIPQISTGDILRASVSAGTALGRRVQRVMESGALVSDDIIIELVRERIRRDDCANGFLFDGFPRTIPQAEALQAADATMDAVIEIQVPDDDVVKRMSGRRVHPGSGRVYHLLYNPPQAQGIDDETGEPLVQREDDREATVRDRLAVYRRQTHPLVKFYRAMASADRLRYIAVDGRDGVHEIEKAISTALQNN